jgi:hypothetical protein
MEEKLVEMLEKLANALGVAVPQIWEFQVAYARVNSELELAGAVLCFVMFFVFYFSCKKDWTQWASKGLYNDYRQVTGVVKSIVFAILFAVCLGCSISFPSMVANCISPEKEAMSTIAGMIKASAPKQN